MILFVFFCLLLSLKINNLSAELPYVEFVVYCCACFRCSTVMLAGLWRLSTNTLPALSVPLTMTRSVSCRPPRSQCAAFDIVDHHLLQSVLARDVASVSATRSQCRVEATLRLVSVSPRSRGSEPRSCLGLVGQRLGLASASPRSHLGLTSVSWLSASVSGWTASCTFLGLPAATSRNEMTYCDRHGDVQVVGGVEMVPVLVTLKGFLMPTAPSTYLPNCDF